MMKMYTTRTIITNSFKLLLAGVVFILANEFNAQEKMYFSLCGFIISFLVALRLIQHTFPFLIFAIACYNAAILQEVWSDSYQYLSITRNIWSTGNVLLGMGALDAFLKIIGVDAFGWLYEYMKKLIF